MDSEASAAAKKRKLQLDSLQCQTRMSSAEGAVPLTNPQNQQHSTQTKDPNRGLYPRKKKKKRKDHGNPNSSDEDSQAPLPLDRLPELKNPAQLDVSAHRDSRNYPSCSGFQPASQIPSAPSHSSGYNPTFQSRKGSGKQPVQTNQILNYFKVSPKKEVDEPKTPCDTPSKSLENKFRSQPVDYSGSSPEIIHESLASIISSSQKKRDEKDEEWPSDDDDDLDIPTCGFFGLDNPGNCKEPCYFEKLPDDIVEMILCHLPLQDLMLNATHVCSRWNHIISSENYLPWKKRYYKLKTSDTPQTDATAFLEDCSAGHNLEKSLILLLRTVNKFKIKPPGDLKDQLQKLKRYNWATSLLDKLRKEFCKDQGGEELSPWCLVLAFVILSETVNDILLVIKQLLNPNSGCGSYDLLELLYCIATVLLAIDFQYSVAKGMLYRTFYAIYLYENEWSASVKDLKVVHQAKSGQQSLYKYGSGKVRLTHEQMRIVNHPQDNNQVVKIVAFAGTGKTTTLVEYTKLRLHQRFLLIVFNKAVCEHAKRTFPGNVECRTAHSLAFADEGRKYRHKMTFKLRPKSIEKYLLRGPTNVAKLQGYAKNVLRTLDSYMNSADELITLAHVPELYLKRRSNNFDDEEEEDNQVVLVLRSIPDEERFGILSDTVRIWKKMIDRNDRDVFMLPDGYLKLHQLNKPEYNGYQCILVDEAQDCNPPMLDVTLRQSCSKILVGDPNQQIYAFRGAIDALSTIESTHTYYLTQSFRFGPEIAYVANTILDVVKNVKRKTLVGGNQNSNVMGKRSGQLAILSRGNATLFIKAVNMIVKKDLKPGEPTEIRGHYIGGTQPLQQLVDIYRLMKQTSEQFGSGPPDLTPIKDKFVSMFSTFTALKSYARNSEDTELMVRISLVEKYLDQTPLYVQTVTDKCSYSLANANVVFTTVHKAKGLEFDTVMLANDFSIGNFPYQPIRENLSAESENEWNLLYVAATRAKKCLLLAPSLYFVLLGAQEKFEYPVLKSDLEREGPIGECTRGRCVNSQLFPDTFVMVRRKLIMGEGETPNSGPVCAGCTSGLAYSEHEIVHPSTPQNNWDEDDLFQIIPLRDNQHAFMKPIFNNGTVRGVR